MEPVRPEVLILSNRFDFATDYITDELASRGTSYVRLNTDDLKDFDIRLYPTEPRLVGINGDFCFEINEGHLKSVYFRCPVFLREGSGRPLSAEEQMVRSQWAAFIRSLMVFDSAKWVNHPQQTYYAETKTVQLKLAHQLGFRIPFTVVSNSMVGMDSVIIDSHEVIVKSLDTLLVREGGVEAFAYSVALDPKGLKSDDMRAAPMTLQEYVNPKADVRVTVVGSSVFSVRIVKSGLGVPGDWRFLKDDVEFIPFQLPESIERKCIQLTRDLGLVFAAIDLLEHQGEFLFLEANPTGEWGWLVDRSGLPIHLNIVDVLMRGNSW